MQSPQHSAWDKINTSVNSNDFDHENGIDNGDDDFLLNKDVRHNDDFLQTNQGYNSVSTTCSC